MKAAAIICWFLAWAWSGLIVAALFSARDGKAREARLELAAGLLGAAGFGLTGAVLW